MVECCSNETKLKMRTSLHINLSAVKPYLFLSLLMLAYSCQNRNAAVKGKEWQLERVIKYKNLVDREGRLVRTKSTLFVYAEGQEVGTVKGDVTYFDYDSMRHRIAERSFDIEKMGIKTW